MLHADTRFPSCFRTLHHAPFSILNFLVTYWGLFYTAVLYGFLCSGQHVHKYLHSLNDRLDRGHTFENAAVDAPLAIAVSLKQSKQLEIMLLGLRTGFCGCLTTFSSWNQAMVTALNMGEGAVQIVVGYALSLFLCLASLKLGQICAANIFLCTLRNSLQRENSSPKSIVPGSSAHFRGASTNVFRVAASVLLLVELIVSASTPIPWLPLRSLCLSLMLSAPGVLIRWWASRSLNTLSFPWGTWTCNLLGCAASALVATNRTPETNRDLEFVLTAVNLGFCGSLSTVSTFVAEVADVLPPPLILSVDNPSFFRAILASGPFYALLSMGFGLLVGYAVSLP